MWTLLRIMIRREKEATGFSILALAIILCVFSVTFIVNLATGAKNVFYRNATQLLGADLILESSDPIASSAQQTAKELALQNTEMIEFFSMVMSDSSMELATISAIQGTFPLRGDIKINPRPGEIWVEEDMLLRLHCQLGDKVHIGAKQFVIAKIITAYPVAISNINIIAPLVYMPISDVLAIDVLQKGSRATYRLLLAGDPASLIKFDHATKAFLGGAVRWITPSEGRGAISRAIMLVQRYLSMILLIQILLAGIAIAMTAHQHSVYLQQKVALWKCLGATHRQVMFYHVIAYLALAIGMILIGIIVAYFATDQIITYVRKWENYSFVVGKEGMWLGGSMGLFLLIGFGWPPLRALQSVTPRQILQSHPPQPLSINITWYGVTLLLLVLIFSGAVQEHEMIVKLIIQWGILNALAFTILWAVWEGLSKLKIRHLPWRLALSYLVRFRAQAILQCIVFTTVIAALILLYIIQFEFLKNWKSQLPVGTPNYFMINIQPENVENVKHWFEARKIERIGFYPITQGRLTHINHRPVEGFYRPINVTWMTALPSDNQVIQGVEWETVLPGSLKISVEKEFAKRQQVKVGDSFTFNIGGESVTAEIVELRSVEWESLHANFFVIFPPGVLEKYSHFYMASLYIPESKKSELVPFVKLFPDVSLIDIDALLEKIREFTFQLAMIINFLLSIVGGLGILILYASILSTLRERIQESALLRVLGAPQRLIQKMLWNEFMAIGGGSGLLGGGIAIIVAHYLGRHYFSVPFLWPIKWLIIGSIGGGIVIPLLGMMGARSVYTVSPYYLWRNTRT